jgi:hypothetical protein
MVHVKVPGPAGIDNKQMKGGLGDKVFEGVMKRWCVWVSQVTYKSEGRQYYTQGMKKENRTEMRGRNRDID